MNFEFSDDLMTLREQARKFLAAECPLKVVRRILELPEPIDRALWRQVAEMGFLGTAVPEEFGGVALGHEGLCVIAEEVGRALAPIPFASSVYLATEALLAHGTPDQKRLYLPKLVSGEWIGTLALAEGPGNPRPEALRTRLAAGRLDGDKWPVPDGSVADFAIIVALDAAGQPGLAIAHLDRPEVTRSTLQTLDPSKDQARLQFSAAPAEALAPTSQGWPAVQALLDRAAVLLAFEQVGGAQASLEMATAYAKDRVAFGRPIGSFQAIKHKLADVYIATELARSNAYYGAWALQAGAPELGLAAAAARVSATEAFQFAAKENIQTHGGMGFTWEMDCHLYYRRAKVLAVGLGSARHWKDRLVDLWAAQQAQAEARSTMVAGHPA